MNKEKFCYEYPRPAVTTDCVIFCFDKNELKVLLIERASDPFKGKWAFPGGFLEVEETAEQGAHRELQEETGIKNVFIEQFHTFSKVDRDPRGRTITIAYYALVRLSEMKVNAGDDASNAGWFTVSSLPALAFDHNEILQVALRELSRKINFSPVAFELLPGKFTIPQLYKIYESVLGVSPDRRNFRKKILKSGLLLDLNEVADADGHRGAKLYSIHMTRYRELMEKEGSFQMVW